MACAQLLNQFATRPFHGFYMGCMNGLTSERTRGPRVGANRRPHRAGPYVGPCVMVDGTEPTHGPISPLSMPMKRANEPASLSIGP